MAAPPKKAQYWQQLKTAAEMGTPIPFSKPYVSYTEAELKGMVDEYLGDTYEQQQTIREEVDAAAAALDLATVAASGTAPGPAGAGVGSPTTAGVAGQSGAPRATLTEAPPVSEWGKYAPETLARLLGVPYSDLPSRRAGLTFNSHGPDDVLRVSSDGKVWYKDEVPKPAIPMPRMRRKVRYVNTGTKKVERRLADGHLDESFEVAGDGHEEAEIKITLPSSSKGGGTKVLSSGNLLVPLNVQLWQNPQATDTLTITCKGLNGYHAAYYMAPASVSGQSDSTLIMGFEETTATPGTVSPYGVEVLNNKLYHPLEAELMASTAANYSISHKTMTTDVANKWQRLANKDRIISAQHDGRLYYIVNNPEGEALEQDCMGNEVWVLDVGTDNPTWSRWLVQGIALHKLQIGNKLYMAVVKPDAIFIFDELAYADEYAEGANTLLRNISWTLETNTLGANRAHDAWANLYQAQIHAGDWIGDFEWGIRGTDVHGRQVEKVKVSEAPQSNAGIDLTGGRVGGGVDLGDATDWLEIKRDMMEWTLFVRSRIKDGDVQMSFGQIDFVQFMLMQLSTNVNTELGSIETFEYQRNVYSGNNTITINGVPRPMNTARP